ncbi:hypothetical protein ABLG96_08320 [Nakamurella sp. A5-74]|uniref:Lipoprotein n=1 Tax=Nakamurella sp. A5-74 TaxID=3158264 RepID=A0AAU8DUK7_9ACTN
MSGSVVLVSALLVSGCASTAPTLADVPASSTKSAPPATTVPESVSGSNAVTTPATVMPCDLVADGSAGVPTARSEPMVTVRFFSTWGQILSPVTVLYRDGAVAVAAESRRSGPEKLLPFTGAKFSPCALRRLELQFATFERAEVGEAGVYDATEGLIERFDSSGARTWALHVNGFGIDDGTQGLPADQQRARTAVTEWFDALTHLRHGVPLGLDRIGVTGNYGLNSGIPEDLAPPVWPPTAKLTNNCTILTGTAAEAAKAAVQKSAAKPGWHAGPGMSYSAWFRFPTRKSKLDLMVFPPAVACLPLDIP